MQPRSTIEDISSTCSSIQAAAPPLPAAILPEFALSIDLRLITSLLQLLFNLLVNIHLEFDTTL